MTDKTMHHPTAPNPIYTRTPLSQSSLAARFLKLERRDDRIYGSVHVHDIDEVDLQWNAISYTWRLQPIGCVESIHTLIINGSALEVGENLWMVLNALLDAREGARKHRNVLRDDEEINKLLPALDIYLWADAICIDQNNDQEKSKQVPLMKDLYSRAQTVIAWLPVNVTVHSPQSIDHQSPQIQPEVYANSYWSRIWIVQEIVLPKKLVFLVKDTWVSPDRMRQGAPTPGVWDLVGPVITLFRARIDFHDKEAPHVDEMTLTRLVRDFFRQGCSNPRDRVYGLLGLLPQDWRIQIDYKKSTLEVFTDAVYAELEVQDRLRKWGSNSNEAVPIEDQIPKREVGDGHELRWQSDLGEGLGMQLNHPITYAIGAVASETLPRKSSATNSTVRLIADWLVKSDAGRRELHHFVTYDFGELTGLNNDGVPNILDPQAWVNLEEIRVLTGCSVAEFRDCLQGTLTMKLYPDSTSPWDPVNLADWFFSTVEGQLELEKGLRFVIKGDPANFEGVLTQIHSLASSSTQSFWDRHSQSLNEELQRFGRAPLERPKTPIKVNLKAHIETSTE